MAHSCNPASVGVTRNAVKVVLNVPAAEAGNTVLVEYSTSPLGPWIGAALLVDDPDNNWCSPLASPITLTSPQSSFIVTAPGVGLNHNTDYYVRVTDQGILGDVVVCGPIKTLDRPIFNCGSQTNVTQNEADLNPFNTNTGQAGGTPHINTNPPCNDDQFRIRYGTTPGGPYPLSTPLRNASEDNYLFHISGLSPLTQYCYIFEATEDQESAGVYATSNECCFFTGGIPAAECDPATNVAVPSATLNGTVLGATTIDTFTFEWGTTPGGPYPNVEGPFPVPSNNFSQPISANITALIAGQQYCYRSGLKDTDGNKVVHTFDSHTIIANPFPMTLNDIAGTHDGSYSGSPIKGITGGSDIGTSQVVIDYEYTVSKNRIKSIRLYNQGGGNLNDFDGISTAKMEVFNSSNVIIFTGTLVAGNGGAPFVLNVGLLNDVKKVRMSNITKLAAFNSVVTPLWREVETFGDAPDNLISAECCFVVPFPPAVVTNPPTGVTFEAATLQGQSLNTPAGCQYVFDYGTTPGGPYDRTVNDGISTGASPEPFSFPLSSLTPNTTYYYVSRVVCNGQTVSTGAEQSFATANAINWCGGWHDPNVCLFVDPGNGEPYSNCNQV